MDCFLCSGRAAATLYNCSAFRIFFQTEKFPIDAPFLCIILGVYFAIFPFFTQENSCLWFKTGCTIQLVIWDLKHNKGWPHLQLSTHWPSHPAAFPANPPHSGNVSYQAFFLFITAEPSFGLCSVHTYPERTLLVVLQKYPLSHYSIFRIH
jgi:hypothetical protein